MSPEHPTEMLFSIIIPTYHRPETLIRAIQSCWHQTYFAPFEVIVVNDGGSLPPDLNSCKPALARLVTIHNPGSGVSAARNAGVAAASGDWIVLLDDDDFFLPNHLEALRNAIAILPKGVHWVSTDFIQIKDGKAVSKVAPHHGLLRLDDFWTDHITTNTSCYPRSAHVPFPEGINYLEDFEQRLQIIGGGGGYFRWKEVTSVVDSSSISATRGEIPPVSLAHIYNSRYRQLCQQFPRFFPRTVGAKKRAPWMWLIFNGHEPMNLLTTLAFAGFLLRHQSSIDRVTFKDIVSRTARRLQVGFVGPLPK